MRLRPSVSSCTRLSLVRGLGSLALLLGLAGCKILPEAQTDPTRNYILASPLPEAPPAAAAAPVTVQLRPIEVASYLRTRAMIVRRGPNEIEFREYAQWGEGLETGIARVLREALLARGAAHAVELSRASLRNGPNARELRVRVLACEGGADGRVYFHAAWEVLGGEGGAGRRGDYRAANLTWDGKDEGMLAARLSDAVGGLAADIADALK